MKSLIFFVALTVFGFSCKKENIEAGQKIEIYLLKSLSNVRSQMSN
jgi:hypothetical protein